MEKREVRKRVKRKLFCPWHHKKTKKNLEVSGHYWLKKKRNEEDIFSGRLSLKTKWISALNIVPTGQNMNIQRVRYFLSVKLYLKGARDSILWKLVFKMKVEILLSWTGKERFFFRSQEAISPSHCFRNIGKHSLLKRINKFGYHGIIIFSLMSYIRRVGE